MSLKDNIVKNFNISKQSKWKRNREEVAEQIPYKMRGKLRIMAERNGEVIHYDEGDNVVTLWAKHATMHLLTGSMFTTHGNIDNGSGTMIYSGRSRSTGHVTDTSNVDGTCISNEQYLDDNTNYPNYWVEPMNLIADAGLGDVSAASFDYAYYPTKMLFGTGVEYANWAAVVTAGHDDSSLTGYGNAKNGSWDETLFDTNTGVSQNYMSNIWSGSAITPARSVNDVYSGIIEGTAPAEDDFALDGAIKDCTYNVAASDGAKLQMLESKYFGQGSYRGIGRPSFVYTTRNLRFMQEEENSEVLLSLGSTSGTEALESKITYTVVLPEQTAGEFYPYNGYTLKVAGLYCDARMLLKNTMPIDTYPGDYDDHEDEYDNYLKQPGGIMWAKRNIAPIYKSHDVKITAQWTIYL